jgi:hypothetical protein
MSHHTVLAKEIEAAKQKVMDAAQAWEWADKAAEVEEIRERVKAGTIPDVVAATLAGVLSVEIQGRGAQ